MENLKKYIPKIKDSQMYTVVEMTKAAIVFADQATSLEAAEQIRTVELNAAEQIKAIELNAAERVKAAEINIHQLSGQLLRKEALMKKKISMVSQR